MDDLETSNDQNSVYEDDEFFGFEEEDKTALPDLFTGKPKFKNRKSVRSTSGSAPIGKRELAAVRKSFFETGVLSLELGDKRNKGYLSLNLTVDESGGKPVIFFNVDVAKLAGRPRQNYRKLEDNDYERIVEAYAERAEQIANGVISVSSLGKELANEIQGVSVSTLKILLWILSKWYIGESWGKFTVPQNALPYIEKAFIRLGKEREFEKAKTVLAELSA